MSKIKLLYDVVTTMKDKESCSGNFKAVCSKDQVKIFGLDKEFEKSMTDGRTKAKINLEVDCEGKKVKHESSTEFDGRGFHGHGHHGLFGRMIARHCHGRHPDHDQIGDGGENERCCGFKNKLSRLACMLSVLNSLKVKEQEDKSAVLSLDFDEIPGEVKKMFHEKLLQKKMFHEKHGHQHFCKEFSNVEILKGELSLLINKDKEVEKIALTVEGRQKDDFNNPHDMSLQAELRLVW